MEGKQNISSFSDSRLVSHPDRPLYQHLGSVDEISGKALNSKWLSPGFASREELDYWRKLLVYFHDFGKATVYFQHKIIQAIIADRTKIGPKVDVEYVDNFYTVHKQYDIKEALDNDSQLGSHALLGAYVLQNCITDHDYLIRAILLEIVKRHHGDLKNFDGDELMLTPDQENQLSTQWEKADREDYNLIVAQTGLSLPEDFLKLVESYGSPRFYRNLKKLLPTRDIQPYLLTLFLFSLLLAADKGDLMLDNRDGVASTFQFPVRLIDSYKEKKFGAQPVKAIDIKREEAYQQVARHIREFSGEPFFSITLPTGLGKTLTAFNAAFILQEQLAAAYQESGVRVVPKIIYCLPFTSVIDQNAAILEEILKLSELKEGYLARHHYLADWPTNKEEIEAISDSEKEYFAEGWEYPFTVTTFVQLLETIFSNRNRKLRKFHNLANAIVILDEVQNIPSKYFETVEAMFQALHDYFGTRFIFVTATQPFLIKNREVLELTDPSRVLTQKFFTEMNRIDLDLSMWKEGPLPLDDLKVRFQEDIQSNRDRSFLFILNKVKDSQELFRFLKNQNPQARMVYLSAAILPTLRKIRIHCIRKPRDGKQLIVVSTQVVEAGVDIDLDIVYRDMAPLDSINQSAGRCNRNGVKGKGVVRLFQSNEGKGIYDSVLVKITESVLDRAIERIGSEVIPEGEFFSLNEDFATEVRTKIADGSAHSEIINLMKKMQFEAVSSSVRLIDQSYHRYSVFIDFSNKSGKVWAEYQRLGKISDRWERKKEMRKLRPRLLQFVVQFPEHALPGYFKERTEPIIYFSKEEYPTYYDLATGYLGNQDKIGNPAKVL
jgi:CRISPR-associated endonuclease/helicase Cas3